MTSEIDISICICTYKRPSLLDALLSHLQELHNGGSALEIVVVDNDPAQSAAPILDSWSRKSSHPLNYAHVATPNISLARNACVRAARGEWIAFVDDDELPAADWVVQLAHAQRRYQADVVFGPVVPLLPPSTPAWILEGAFFDRSRQKSGSAVTPRDMRTGNVLIRKDLFVNPPLEFDARFGRTGGEDTVLFAQLIRQGRTMAWCDEAIVEEVIPQERLNLMWLLQRSLRGGQSCIIAQLQVRSGLERWKFTLRHIVEGLGRIPVNGAAILIFAPFSKVRTYRNMRHLARNIGIVLAIAGHRYQEYRH